MEAINKIQTKNKKIYSDFEYVKSNIFQENVTSINSLLFGQGIKINNSPFIYQDEKDKKIIYQQLNVSLKHLQILKYFISLEAFFILLFILSIFYFT